MAPKHQADLPWDREFASRSPLFGPLRRAAEPLRGFMRWPNRAALDRLLANRAQPVVTRSGRVLRLGPARTGSDNASADYESRIYHNGELPTRETSWHDLLNLLVWLTFPQAKAALNQRHCSEPRAPRAANGRTATADALTLFDESGVIVASTDAALLALLRSFAWKELFWRKRAEAVKRMRFVVFGHGLYQQALDPFVGMTGKALLLHVAEDFVASPVEEQLAHLDERAAEEISCNTRFLGTHELAPLPILGVPGWTPENALPAYYDNTDYFRSGRRE
jgi:hypothetical protein